MAGAGERIRPIAARMPASCITRRETGGRRGNPFAAVQHAAKGGETPAIIRSAALTIGEAQALQLESRDGLNGPEL